MSVMRVTTTTPEQDRVLDQLRGTLREWMIARAREHAPHDLIVTSLALFTASGMRSRGLTRGQFLEIMGEYFDIYDRGYS